MVHEELELEAPRQALVSLAAVRKHLERWQGLVSDVEECVRKVGIQIPLGLSSFTFVLCLL